MKVVQLFEMPDFIDKEMPSFGTINGFYSNEALDRSFKLIGRFGDFHCYFNTSAEFAVIGKPAIRKEDSKLGLEEYGRIDFKHGIDASWEKDFEFAGHVLQIDGVEISSKFKQKGFGTGAYFTFAKRGYVIISDNTQYVGGKMLWKKIAAMAKAHNMFVYVIDNGNLKRESSGAPLIYDGSNIDDAELWNVPQKTPVDSKKHVLFALTAKEVK